MEDTLTSYQDPSGVTIKLWRNYPEQTTEKQREREKTYNLRQGVSFSTTCLVRSEVVTQEGWCGTHRWQCWRDN